MGRIKKAATERHMATLSPFVKDFVKRATEAPLYQLPALLDSFPQHWPLPRGDLYHWIPLLDRFDHILELFSKEYALNEGPQTQPFERRLLEKGDAEDGMPYPSTGSNAQELESQGYSTEGDRELAESLLHFTRVLLEHCGNRSLYSSSAHINDLLHTTSLSLLRRCLKLSLRLAQRYQVARYKNHHPSAQAVLLANHYSLNLDNLHKIAMPFPKPYSSGPALGQTPGKGKEKSAQSTAFNPSDLVAIAKEPLSSTTRDELSTVSMFYYEAAATSTSTQQSTTHQPTEASPSTPTPSRRTSNLGPSRDRPSTGDRSISANDIANTPVKSREDPTSSNAPKLFHIPASKVAEMPAWMIAKEAMPSLPSDMRYEMLNRIRIAKAFTSPETSSQELLEVRMFAIANLAYALTESKFQEKIGNADAEEPRRYHLAQQLCDLLQPATKSQTALTLQSETAVIMTLDALTKCRHKALEVADALSITVNHGILYYELRKVMSTLHVEEHADKMAELQEAEWRDCTFDLVNSLLQSNAQARYGEKMVSAGIMGILVEALSLRTNRAEKFHERVLQFFDSFVHGVSTAFQTLASVKGLDIIAELTAFEVDAALENAHNGNGLPQELKSKVVDYEIPFYQQSTLRQLFKNTGHMFEHNAGQQERLLRNLIDTPQILGALRKVIENARVFGSNVWGGAVTIVTQFIHHEPTSYQVIGEAGLSKAFIESITEQQIPDELPALNDFVPAQATQGLDVTADGEPSYPSVRGILPVGEVMIGIPAAFGAICLNESGMQLFQASGALAKYFDIFLSPTHVRAMEDESQTAASIGSSFDELSRHHPRLKEQIKAAVLNMLRRLKDLCSILAEKKRAGAKLWERRDSSLAIAGGLAAVKGPNASDYEAALSGAADFLPSKGSPPLDEPTEQDDRERAPAIPYLSACFKFLEGFFHSNSNMCGLFCEDSGADLLLDLAMSPSAPHDLVAFPLFNKVTQVFKLMCDAKAPLVLPSLIRRMQHAILGVKDLISARSSSSSFDGFVNLSEPTTSPFPDGRDATTVVKSLVNAHLLTHVLGRALAPPSYSLRHANQANHLFINMNFTDIYLELVDELSKLHAACVWEGLLLMPNVSEEAKTKTDPQPFVMRRIDANGVVEIASEKHSDPSRNGNSQANGATETNSGKNREELLSIKNLRTVRYLLSQVPMGIESFFFSLSQAIVTKRMDNPVKQHAILIADRLAQAFVWQLDFRRNEGREEAMETKYAAGMLTMFGRMLLRNTYTGEPYNGKEALTLVLSRFYVAGGFAKMNEYLNRFVGLLTKQGGHEKAEPHVKDAIHAILSFYIQVVRSKCITDAGQTPNILGRYKETPEFFQPGQFLVEIRDAILPAISNLWHSNEIEYFSDANMKSVVQILCTTLKAEGEDRALRRSERASRRVLAQRPQFKLQDSAPNLKEIMKCAKGDTRLGREAAYRCNSNLVNAEAYCKLRLKDPRVPRFPAPDEEASNDDVAAPGTQPGSSETASRPDVDMSGASAEDQESVEMSDANDRGGMHTESLTQNADDNDAMSDDDSNDGTLGRLPADLRTEDLSAMGDTRALELLSSAHSKDTQQLYVTLDDLDEKRKALRDDLIDRCLDVLSTHPTISFELSDLIQAAVAKTGEGANPRADIGTTLVSSLMSLQAEEPSKESGRKIHAYAHLVALILQDRDFFDSTLDELKEYFENLVTWVQLDNDQKVEDAPWIEMILLIIERVLAEDEQPMEVDWKPPPADDPLKPMPTVPPSEPVVSSDLRSQLFTALVDLLPKIGKNSKLALSVARVLVVLTRDRELAGRLSEKHTMGRLFLMIRQLAGSVEAKLRSSFMLILRHMVEDDEAIRQTTRTEIRAAFENHRSGRGMDTSSYTRTLFHLVLRSPEIFVEVTQEMVEITRYDGNPSRGQNLALKKNEDVTPEQAHKGNAGDPSEANGEPSEAQKPAEPTMPVVETTDGVVQFLLRELSNYRDVEEKPSQPPKEGQEDNSVSESAPAEVDMPDVASAADRSPPRPREPTNQNKTKPSFKAEEHTIYIYRCFLLQCLAELLGSYNKTKIEFINFSRKSETQPSTPSKPRAGTLNYLLNVLVPIGTLEHRDDLTQRKKVATSNWATNVLVALCTKTAERVAKSTRPLSANEFAEQEPELTFVRKFALEHALRAFKEAMTSSDALDERYSRLLALGDLFNRMLEDKADLHRAHVVALGQHASHQQMGRLMYEKNFIGALTSAIAELDLNFPNAKRAVKYILSPLKQLTDLGVTLSQTSDLSSGTGTSTEDDEIASATSWSEEDEDEREQTPDMYRGSSLNEIERGGAGEEEDDSESDEDDDDEDDEMDYDAYDEEMDYEEEPDHGEVVSDEDEEIGDMGEVEGVPGDVEIEVDMMMGDEDDDEDDDDDDDEDDEDDDDEDPDMDVDFADQMDEITGDDENASMGDHEGDGAWDDDDADFDDQAPPHDGGSPHGGPLEHIAHIIGAEDPSDAGDADGIVRIDMGDGEEEFFEDEMAPEDEDEEAEFAEDIVYEPGLDEEDEDQDANWAWDAQPAQAILRQPHHHHHHLHHHPRAFNDVFGMLGGGPPQFRTHRGTPNTRDEDGLNPLLQRGGGNANNTGNADLDLAGLPARFAGRRAFLPRDHILQDIVSQVSQGANAGIINVNVDPMAIPGFAALPPMFTVPHGHGGPRAMIDIDPRRPWREQLGGPNWPDMRSGHGHHDETAAIEFRPEQTSGRWQEEARMLFPGKYHEKATRINSRILRALIPAAMEAKRKREKEESERRAAEAKAAEEAQKKEEAEKAEREAHEKKEREEQEAKEREEAEARAREEAEQSAQPAPEAQDVNMEGEEQESQSAPEGEARPETAQEPPAERITVNIRGRELDITSLGIDREYIEALPEDMREEVIMAQFAEQRSQQVESGEGPSEISREFLEALPRDIQQELIRSEQMERRRRERDEARRRAAQEGAAAQPEEMNNADFMAMLDPGLRQAVLMDADEAVLASLPEDLQAEARALLGGERRARGEGAARLGRGLDAAGARILNGNAGAARHDVEATREANRRRPVAQMLDKPGVATLLRLMFVSLNHKAKTNLHSILSDVCKNTQNRAEVISILLSILQDGTADVNAVERSFAQLSLRAKQPSGPKTPQPLKRSLTGQPGVTPSTELSPLNIVQQCLGTLNALANDNQRVSYFFLNEHETSTSQKAKAAKKGKGRETKAAKFPINALLALLDRKLITENTAVMETLASLLSQITRPLTTLLRKAKEAQDESVAAAEAETSANDESEERPNTGASDVPMQEAAEVESPEAEGAEASNAAAAEPTTDDKDEVKKKQKELKPPDVPEENIRLVVNILAARECPSKTFSDSLDIIKHLSAIPGAKEVFGKELIRQAQQLGQDLLNDLEELARQINAAQTGTDLQGMALASFSSAGSKQRKLLRVLVALDHLFDPKRIPTVQTSTASSSDVDQKLKEDILATLYESSTFDKLWHSLSVCLAAIRQRGNMVNVATILLPLIESLMVVCRNSALKETPAAAAAAVTSPTESTAVSTPPPEARMEGLFFNFTEEHRKILNELIRNNPKLMNGNLSVLAKNSKVLEFDNKRNYFSRKLHDRRSEVRVSHPALQLSVRRDQVFLDSFKSLYYKTGNEIKYGKLNIRFHGEEGIDAGGVSREWFAAMARQMFNPDYALFNPVASDRTTFHPNSLSEVNPEHLLFFKFIGRIIGKALYENRVLDCHFSRAVYRRILGKSVSLKDMETLDLDYYKSLVWILENDITDVTFETFSVDVDRFGVTETIDLIPNGRDIAVTEENKQEYVRLVVDYRLIKSVQEQLDHFLDGFHEIIPAELVSIFNEQELELLISGLPDIDVDDWKNNTEYHNYQATSPQIQWFWRAVRSFDKEEKAKLLQFVTGTSKVPLNGFKELEGMNGFAKFNIHRDYSSKEKLPSSHTCFNQLDLPEYESYEHLRQQLYTAITAGSEYFGFA